MDHAFGSRSHFRGQSRLSVVLMSQTSTLRFFLPINSRESLHAAHPCAAPRFTHLRSAFRFSSSRFNFCPRNTSHVVPRNSTSSSKTSSTPADPFHAAHPCAAPCFCVLFRGKSRLAVMPHPCSAFSRLRAAFPRPRAWGNPAFGSCRCPQLPLLALFLPINSRESIHAAHPCAAPCFLRTYKTVRSVRLCPTFERKPTLRSHRCPELPRFAFFTLRFFLPINSRKPLHAAHPCAAPCFCTQFRSHHLFREKPRLAVLSRPRAVTAGIMSTAFRPDEPKRTNATPSPAT